MNCRIVFICCWCLFFLISCASKKNLIILPPDPDGQVGKGVVSNGAGTQILTAPPHATEVKVLDVSPTSPVPMEEEEISKVFADVLTALPEPPSRYLLYFKSGSIELTEESQGRIAEVLSAIEARKFNDISVVGHADRTGSREANYKLALERAAFFKTFLVSKGVDPSGVGVASHGEDDPLVKTEDGVAEPRNRRIEITVR